MGVSKKVHPIPFYEEWHLFQTKHYVSENIRAEIVTSWQEAKDAGICGFDKPQFMFLNDEKYQIAVSRSQHLIKAVHMNISRLTSQLGSPIHYPIALFNDQGIMLHEFDSELSGFSKLIGNRYGLLAGFPNIGYTAISLTLRTSKAQVMIGAEHTYSEFHKYTTLAAPIFHPINRECIGALATIIPYNEPYTSKHALLITLAMAVEECIRMEYSQANIFKIHEETTNLIDHYVGVISSDGRIIDCNTALKNFLAPDPLIGRMAIDVLMKWFDHDIKSSPLYRAIYYAEETPNYEAWLKVKGKRYCFLCDTKIIHDPFDPEFYWIVLVFKDITEKKEMELNMLQREKLISLGTLAAGLAHEIRNPLTTAKGFIQFLSENSPDKEAFALVQNELNRITQLVNQFVLLSKPDSPQIKPLLVSALITDFATFIQPEALLKGIEVELKLCDLGATILADKNQITQVFINLAQNAFAAMQHNGKLIIECNDQRPDYVEIYFIDNGKGIEDEHLDKILDPFFTTNEEGTGLGLPICFQIIEAHKGELKFDSEVGVGTKVTIRLPKEHS